MKNSCTNLLMTHEKIILFQLIIHHYNATHNNNNDNNQVTGCSFVGGMHTAWLRYGQQSQHIRTNSKPEELQGMRYHGCSWCTNP